MTSPLRHNLIDQFRLTIFSVALGAGKRLFRDEGDKIALRLADVKTTKTGVVMLTYQVAGTNGEGSAATG